MTNEPAHQLRQTILRLARRVRAERADDAMSDGRLSVLFLLVNHGAQTLGSLSEFERVTPPSMNRTVNALVESGYASRSGSPDDGRKVLIDVTEDGHTVIRETRRRRDAWFSRRLADLTPEQRQILELSAPVLRELADS